ncbi:hypothetical protein [Mesorhizobium sp. dw_380]|uniref:hypothetical protein n=1 Tax=Mesorhizobium sp. dw_380 TaxID=2812001 RepID=UPI001BDE4996|nr:hypothetical protein [Mesorhizobium sp. dw_380]
MIEPPSCPLAGHQLAAGALQAMAASFFALRGTARVRHATQFLDSPERRRSFRRLAVIISPDRNSVIFSIHSKSVLLPAASQFGALPLDRMQKRGHVSDKQKRDFVARSGILLAHHSR